MFIEGFAVGIGIMVLFLILVLVASSGYSNNSTINHGASVDFLEKMRDRNRDYFNNPVVEYMKRTDRH